jgi:hypothetical protein
VNRMCVSHFLFYFNAYAKTIMRQLFVNATMKL